MKSLRSFKRPACALATYQPSGASLSNRTPLYVSQRSTQDAALAAFQKAKLIPVIFQERITSGTGIYKFDPVHAKEDIANFKKREEERKIETNVLEFLREGETEETVNGIVLFERYMAKYKKDKAEQAETLEKIQQGKEIIHEHPYDVLKDVASPLPASFQECWKRLNDFERLRFPGQFPRKSLLMDIMRHSRTRLHFVRTLHWLHMYDKTNIPWNDSEKMQILQFCDKHDYLLYVVNKLTDPLSKFFPNRSHFEFALRMSLRMGRIGDATVFEELIRNNYKTFSRKGYHIAVQYFHIAGMYHKSVRYFIEFLSTNPSSYSMALWDHFIKCILLGNFPKAMRDLKPLIKDPQSLPQFVLGGIVMGYALAKDQESLKELLSSIRDPQGAINKGAAWVNEIRKYQKKTNANTFFPLESFPDLTNRIRTYGKEILDEIRPKATESTAEATPEAEAEAAPEAIPEAEAEAEAASETTESLESVPEAEASESQNTTEKSG